MTEITLNNGVNLPTLGLGTYKLREPYVQRMVCQALQLGYRLIDTASVYHNEHDIGRILRKLPDFGLCREDIFLTSKLGPGDHGTDSSRETVNDSLSKLQVEYLDLYLIHWPGVEGQKPDSSQQAVLRKESWLQLEQLNKEGKLRAIGVSNYTVHHLKELLSYCSVIPAVLQVEVHPYLVQADLRQFCKENGIHVQSYSSLGSSLGCQELLSDKIVQEIAAETKRSPAQVLLRWAVQHGMSVIPKTQNPQRLKENRQIFDFNLTEDHIERLDKLDKNYHFCWDPTHIV